MLAEFYPLFSKKSCKIKDRKPIPLMLLVTETMKCISVTNMTHIFLVVPNVQILVLFKDCYLLKKKKKQNKC